MRASALVPGGSYIGVGLQEIDEERARALKLKEVTGVEISRVQDDSPASRAGLQAGDIVLEYDGQRVVGMEEFSRLVRETPVGREVKMRISRAGAERTLTVKVGSRPGPASVYEGIAISTPRVSIPDFPMPDIPRTLMSWRSATLGVEAEALGGQLAGYFGVKEGVLVRSVMRGSAAEKAGIKAGDVILKVDDRPVAAPGEVSSALRSVRGKKPIEITLMREHKEMTVTATVDEDHSEWFSIPAPPVPPGC
jgi:serine protease Do